MQCAVEGRMFCIVQYYSLVDGGRMFTLPGSRRPIHSFKVALMRESTRTESFVDAQPVSSAFRRIIISQRFKVKSSQRYSGVEFAMLGGMFNRYTSAEKQASSL